MTTSSKVVPGEIWLAYLHFLDRPEIGKVRPVLVLRYEESVLVVAKITSSNLEISDFPGIFLDEWESCGLLKPSWIQLDPIFELKESDLIQDEPLGKIDSNLLNVVLKEIEAI